MGTMAKLKQFLTEVNRREDSGRVEALLATESRVDQEEEEIGSNVMVMKYLGELAYFVREGNDNKPFCAVISRRIGTA
jgi:hypothetical protein